MTDKRKKLINELKGELTRYGFYGYDDPFCIGSVITDDDLHNLEYVRSDSQLARMLNALRVKHFDSAADFMSYCKDNELLAIDPCVINDSVPSLVLGWGKYLHWFRGYYFQVSCTQKGVGSVYSGADRMDYVMHDLQSLSYRSIRDADDARKFIMIACMLPVLLFEGCGRRVLAGHLDILNGFLEKTGRCERITNVAYADFQRYLEVRDYQEPPSFPFDIFGAKDGDLAIRIIHDDGFGYGLLTISADNITFTRRLGDKHYQTMKLNVPEWVFAKDECGAYYLTEQHVCYRIMVRALMALGGFRADYLCMYPVGVKHGSLKRLNYNLPNSASSWYEIEKFSDDFVQSVFDEEGRS